MTNIEEPACVRRLKPNESSLPDQQGQSLVILTFAMVALLAFMGLALDLGIVYGRRIQLRRATDAAAMAAVIEPSSSTPISLTLRASQFVAVNGFPVPPSVVTATRVVSPGVGSARVVRVDAEVAVGTMFMHLVGVPTVGIHESSLAEFVSPVETLVSQPTVVSSPTISPTVVYGIVQDWNLLVMGPDGMAEWGDAYLPTELSSGVPNPQYGDLQGIYPFRIFVPDDYPSDILLVEILDPGSSNEQCGGGGYGYNAATGEPQCMDGHSSQPTTETEYTLLYFDTDGYRHVIDSRSFGADNVITDMRWYNTFTVRLSDYPDIFTTDSGSRSFYLEVGTPSGGRANGFHLYAGLPHTLPDDLDSRNAALRADPDREDTGGVFIYGQGYLPLNTYPSHTPITMTLAYIPPEAAGHTVSVYNFDLDCLSGSQVEFYLEGTPSFSPQAASISCDGVWQATNLQLPGPDRFFGGFLRARFREGGTSWTGNESTWRLEYDDLVTQLATVRLVQ
jgi:Flp pilus assembly protein TadG